MRDDTNSQSFGGLNKKMYTKICCYSHWQMTVNLWYSIPSILPSLWSHDRKNMLWKMNVNKEEVSHVLIHCVLFTTLVVNNKIQKQVKANQKPRCTAPIQYKALCLVSWGNRYCNQRILETILSHRHLLLWHLPPQNSKSIRGKDLSKT